MESTTTPVSVLLVIMESTVQIEDCAASPCQNGGTCVDGVNTYTCQCATGFTGSTCSDIDDCPAMNPCQNGGSCVDGVDSYTCNCPSRFSGNNCETGRFNSKTCKINMSCIVNPIMFGTFRMQPILGTTSELAHGRSAGCLQEL